MKHAARILVLLIALVLPFALLRFEPTRALLVAFMDFIRDAGPLGVVAFMAAEVVAGIFAVPIWLMAGIAGYVFGFTKGFLLALPGVTLAGTSAFLCGRFLLRGVIERRAAENVYLRAIARVVSTQGLKITFLLRVTPVMPQNLLGYLLSTTSLGVRPFALGTFFGLVLTMGVQVYVGSIVQSAAQLLSGETKMEGAMQWGALVGGALLCVLGIAATARMGRRALNEALEQGER